MPRACLSFKTQAQAHSTHTLLASPTVTATALPGVDVDKMDVDMKGEG